MLLGNQPIGTVAFMGGVPAVLTSFWWSCIQLVQCVSETCCNPGEYVHYDRATFSDHAPARNGLVANMQGDWILMLDTDHAFDPDILARMLKRFNDHALDVLVGVYCYKAPPHAPLIFHDTGDGQMHLIANWDREGLVRIDSAGAGCLLVRRTVFDRIKREIGGGPFDREGAYSEDHSFFRKCQRLGIEAYADTRIECNHLRTQPVTLDDFRKQNVPLGERLAVGGLA